MMICRIILSAYYEQGHGFEEVCDVTLSSTVDNIYCPAGLVYEPCAIILLLLQLSYINQEASDFLHQSIFLIVILAWNIRIQDNKKTRYIYCLVYIAEVKQTRSMACFDRYK